MSRKTGDRNEIIRQNQIVPGEKINYSINTQKEQMEYNFKALDFQSKKREFDLKQQNPPYDPKDPSELALPPDS